MLLVVLAVVLLTACGLAVAVWLPRGGRPAALLLPLLGAAALVTVLHLATLLLPVRSAAAPAVAAVALSLTLAWHRRRDALLDWTGDVGKSWPEGLVALGTAVLALLPNLRAGTVAPALASANNDVFYYLSVSAWLQDNPGTRLPDLGAGPGTSTDGPFYGAALQTLSLPMRYGQELVQAWLSSVTGVDLVYGISAWTATYVGLMSLALAAGVLALGGGRLLAALAGAGVATSAAVLGQVRDQNSDSLLGIALGIGLIVVVATALAAPRDDTRTRQVWLAPASLLLAALVGTYFEILPFLLVVLGVMALVGRPGGLGSRLRWSALVVALSLVVGAAGAWRAYRGLSVITSAVGSSEGSSWSFSSLLGPLAWPEQSGYALTAAVAAVVVGLGAVVWLSFRSTPWVIVATVALVGLTVVVAARSGPYAAARAVGFATPLLITLAVLAFAIAAQRLRAQQAWPALVAAALVAGVCWVTLNQVAVASRVDGDDTDRVVDAEALAPARWLDPLTSDGSDVEVVAPTFIDELVLAAQLRDLPDVRWNTLRGYLGYLGGFMTQPTAVEEFTDDDPSPPRYLLLGSGVPYTAGDTAVVARNDRFALIDLRRGSYAIAAPSGDVQRWNYDPSDVAGQQVVFGTAPVSFDLITSPDVTSVAIDVASNPALEQPRLRIGTGVRGWSVSKAEPDQIEVRRSGSSARRGEVDIRSALHGVALTDVEVLDRSPTG